jgi:hypothetical protein
MFMIEAAAPDYRAILTELIELGAELARKIVRSARDPDAYAQVPDKLLMRMPDPSAAFDRVSRAIRRCIALVQTLNAPPAGRPARVEPPERPDRIDPTDMPAMIASISRDLARTPRYDSPPSIAQLRAEADELRKSLSPDHPDREPPPQPKFRALRHPRAR